LANDLVRPQDAINANRSLVAYLPPMRDRATASTCAGYPDGVKALGMSATEIATELGIHRSTVYRNFKEAP
jgi:DNA invertase Pin-like site-specific DNA recombinase